MTKTPKTRVRATGRGGDASNKLREVGVKTGKAARGIRLGDAAMIGIQRITTTGPGVPQGSHKTISIPLGNAKALDVGGGGVGVGRTVMPTGSQGRHGGKE